MIYLTGVYSQDLHSLLRLIYFGEVTFLTKRIETMLNVFQRFKLTGFELPLFKKIGNEKIENSGHIAKRHKTKRMHLIDNPDAQQFQCEICESCYNTNYGLKLHKESKHEGKKYSCNYCDYMATTQSNQRKHEQSIHEGVRYECNQCDYNATQSSSLRAHKRKKHEKSIEERKNN